MTDTPPAPEQSTLKADILVNKDYQSNSVFFARKLIA